MPYDSKLEKLSINLSIKNDWFFAWENTNSIFPLSVVFRKFPHFYFIPPRNNQPTDGRSAVSIGKKPARNRLINSRRIPRTDASQSGQADYALDRLGFLEWTRRSFCLMTPACAALRFDSIDVDRLGESHFLWEETERVVSSSWGSTAAAGASRSGFSANSLFYSFFFLFSSALSLSVSLWARD